MRFHFHTQRVSVPTHAPTLYNPFQDCTFSKPHGRKGSAVYADTSSVYIGYVKVIDAVSETGALYLSASDTTVTNVHIVDPTVGWDGESVGLHISHVYTAVVDNVLIEKPDGGSSVVVDTVTGGITFDKVLIFHSLSREHSVELDDIDGWTVNAFIVCEKQRRNSYVDCGLGLGLCTEIEVEDSCRTACMKEPEFCFSDFFEPEDGDLISQCKRCDWEGVISSTVEGGRAGALNDDGSNGLAGEFVRVCECSFWLVCSFGNV